MARRPRRRGPPRARRSGRRGGRSRGGARSRTSCGPASSASIASCTMRSLFASSELVASSKTRIAGSRTIARAIVTRWRWPPESFTPASPTSVSQPSGSVVDELVHVRGRARRPRARASVASARAVADVVADRAREEERLLASRPRRGRAATRARSARRSTPSIVIAPFSGSKKRSSRSTSVVLPPPVRPTIATISPALHLERDVAQHRLAAVGEASRSRSGSPSRTPAKRQGARRVGRLAGRVDQLEEAVGRGHRVLELGPRLGEVLHGAVGDLHRDRERHRASRARGPSCRARAGRRRSRSRRRSRCSAPRRRCARARGSSPPSCCGGSSAGSRARSAPPRPPRRGTP